MDEYVGRILAIVFHKDFDSMENADVKDRLNDILRDCYAHGRLAENARIVKLMEKQISHVKL